MLNYLCLVILGLSSTSLTSQQVSDWLALGKVNQRQGDFHYAMTHYNIYINQHPQDPMGYLHRAKLYEAMGRTTESNFDLKVAQRLNPLSLAHISPSLRSQNSNKKAYFYSFEDLDRAFIDSPAKASDYRLLVEEIDLVMNEHIQISNVITEIENSNLTEARNLLDQINVSVINKAILADLSGKIEMKNGNLDRALVHFSTAINYNPSFAIAYHNRSICHQLLEDYEMAKEDLNKAVTLNGSIAMFHFTKDRLNASLGENHSVLSNYEEAISLGGNYDEVMVNYSRLLKGLGEYQEATINLNKALDSGLPKVEYNLNKANLHFVYGEYLDAIEYYNQYLADYPDDIDVLYNRGLSKVMLRRYDSGCEDISTSLNESDDDNRRMIYNMFCKKRNDSNFLE
jgi:tetratricopeptide (TPR) repeat protein